MWENDHLDQYEMIHGSKLINRPRPTNSISNLFDPALTVDNLINPTSCTWNMHAIRTLIDTANATLIEKNPLSRIKS